MSLTDNQAIITAIGNDYGYQNIFVDQIEKEYWINIMDTFYKTGKPDTWDYSWVLTCLVNNALIAIPNKNLISLNGRIQKS